MAQLDAIDCQGFAGGFTLGTVQAGFRLVGKREHPGGFGTPACENNRHLLGTKWVAQACQSEAWEPYLVPYVFGNPPCSGFSLLSPKGFRGPDSRINSCMWDFVGFAARCGAQVAVFESVAQAYKQGRDLMSNLRADLEAKTQDRWDLTHVLHNAYSLGGPAHRKRYFWVAHRVPFGVEDVHLTALPTLRDAISDLEGLGDTWNKQEYRRPPSWWATRLRSRSGLVDGHVTQKTPLFRRAMDLMSLVDWGTRESISDVMRKYWDKVGDLPESWKHLGSYQKLVAQAPDFQMGFNQLFRWDYEQAARVVTGGALQLVMHPVEQRTVTHREALRIMGFPDDWRIRELRGTSGLPAYWGKGITVDCGRWISTWVRESIEGRPGSLVGEEVGDRERLVDVTNSYRRTPVV